MFKMGTDPKPHPYQVARVSVGNWRHLLGSPWRTRYLKYQLNFSAKKIIAAGDSSSKLSVISKNLTTDANDPYDLFKFLLPHKTTTHNGIDADSPQPIFIVSLTFNKDSYKKSAWKISLRSRVGCFSMNCRLTSKASHQTLWLVLISRISGQIQTWVSLHS